MAWQGRARCSEPPYMAGHCRARWLTSTNAAACRRRYASTYLVVDVLACIPLDCIMIAANPYIQASCCRLVPDGTHRSGSLAHWLWAAGL